MEHNERDRFLAAAQVGGALAVHPEDVLAPVLGLLTTLSLRRHGQAALVRALSRPQRGPGSIAAC